MSSKPCVGWAWRPSPALITCTCGATWLAMRCAAPLEGCRTTNMSACIADRLSTVSSSVSPLDDEDTAMFRLITSAERRLAAISNVVRVRVDGSKNRLNTDLPRSSGTFFTSRSVTPMNEAAVSRMRSSTSRGNPSIVSRCWSDPSPLSCGFRIGEPKGEFPVLVARQAQELPGGDRQCRADVLRLDRQLALAAVDERRELDLAGTPVIEQLVHRRAHRAPGIEHVVDHHDVAVVHVERDLRRLHPAPQAHRVEVIAVEGDVERAQRRRDAQLAVQALGEPCAAGADADEPGGIADPGAQLACELPAQRFSVGECHRSSSGG